MRILEKFTTYRLLLLFILKIIEILPGGLVHPTSIIHFHLGMGSQTKGLCFIVSLGETL